MNVTHDSTPDALTKAARLCAAIGGQLVIELRQADDLAVRDPLLPADLYTLARDAAHHGRIVLAAVTRVCRRCDAPLATPLARRDGRCDTCLAEADARRARVAEAVQR